MKSGGIWREAQPFVKNGGVWKSAEAYVKNGGVWKVAAATDTTPPPAPTMTLTVRDGRYVEVGIKVGTSDVADLSLVRVLVSTTGFPGSPLASGYISQADATWPAEPWSDWKYTGSTRTNSSQVYVKNYPQNANDATQLTGDRYYYFSAFAQDEAGNWSGVTQSRIWVAAAPSTPGEDPTPPIDPYDPEDPEPGTDEPGDGGTDTPTEPVPTPTDTRTQQTLVFYPNWSRSFYGQVKDGAVYAYGDTLKVGPWPGNGGMRSLIGWPEVEMARLLKGATILKVELRLTTKNQYYQRGEVRFNYHALATPPSDIEGVSHFGTWVVSGQWPDNTTRWIDITSASPDQWKSGAKKGIFLSSSDLSSLWTAVTIAGHELERKPALRFTVLK